MCFKNLLEVLRIRRKREEGRGGGHNRREERKMIWRRLRRRRKVVVMAVSRMKIRSTKSMWKWKEKMKKVESVMSFFSSIAPEVI